MSNIPTWGSRQELRLMYEKIMENYSLPKPVGWPCCLGGYKATHYIAGGVPDGSGGGILYWCYSLPEAMATFVWCEQHFYRNLSLVNTSDGLAGKWTNDPQVK